MSHLYKQYMRVIAKWPRDKFKNDQRNLGFFFERELEKVFKYSPIAPETGICERRLKALTELVDNRHQHDFPHKYTSGIFGMKLSQLHEINSDEFRQQIGLGEPKKSLFARLFGRK
uniref:Ubiquinol-cytochrome-c reductase complex assembly factor 2 n=1 Tax=Panagrolaimus superbus TaxID=310955 RepID=A0A914YVC3_9BILA